MTVKTFVPGDHDGENGQKNAFLMKGWGMKGTQVSDEGEGQDVRPTDSTSGTGFQAGKERRFHVPALFL